MAIINSTIGKLDTANLGFTLMHEHIMSCPPGVHQDYPELLGKDRLERIIEDLKKALAGGINTIVDATTIDLGRDIHVLAEASKQSGINIIACTGWWMNIPARQFAGITPDQLSQCFVNDIEKGISGTSIKAGILKAASDMQGVTAQEEIILRGVARAHQKTGIPIMLHSYSLGRVGQQQIAILKEEGVDLKRVKMDHSNDTTDVEYLLWLLDQGCYLGMDRYPGWNVSPLARTKTLKTLIDAGYAKRICLSHDRASLRITPAKLPIPNTHGYLYVKNVVFSQLREMGVSESVIDKLCIDSPRNFFDGV